MQTRKFGYLEFRYGNDPKRRTANVGDNIQSIAVRKLLARLDVPAADIVGIDRDSLRNYDGEPVALIMNGCFHEECFPLSPRIQPIFFGFNAESESVITANKALFLKHQPIGCRDSATKRMFDSHGIAAYVTGCATLTLERREATPALPRPVIAFGAGAGVLHQKLLEKIPKRILEQARLVFQREPVSETPLSDASLAHMDRLAQAYLDIYRNEAGIVITPLLHVASPCIAMGIPVVLARRDRDDRFSAIDRLLPVYTPDEFAGIEWDVRAPEIEALKTAMVNVARAQLEGARPKAEDLSVLSRTFEAPPVLQAPEARDWRSRIKKALRRK